jgi:hypothetical protein
VKEGCERQFLALNERNWTDFFGQSRRYHGTDIEKISEKPLVYRTIDRWDSREDFEEFKKTHRAEYDILESCHKDVYEGARHVEWFDLALGYSIRNDFNDLLIVKIEDGRKLIDKRALTFSAYTWQQARETIDSYLREKGFDFVALPEDYRNLKKLTVIPDKKSDIHFAYLKIS